jgi:hypothetical protein
VAHVFISYARRDSAFVDRLAGALEHRGFDVWLDRSDIVGGTAWDASICEALQDAAQVIVVLSPAALESEHVARELALAGDYERRIIPVEYQPAPLSTDRSPVEHQIHFRLAGLQRVDFVRQDFDLAFERLVDALSPAQAQPRSPAPPDVAPTRRPFRRAFALAAAGAGLLLAATVLVRVLTSPPAGPPAGAAVTGEWFARVVYSWGDAFDERFEFAPEGNALHGTAGYHLYPEEIQDGKIDGDRLSFQLRRTVRVNDRERPVTYRYQGKLADGVIRFTMVDDLDRHPVAFTAARSREAAVAAAAKRPTAGTDPSLLPFSSSQYPVDAVRRRIEERMDAIRACYRATEFDPVDHQSACYALSVDAGGQVTGIDTTQGQRSAALDACIERILRGIAWGPPEGGRPFPTRLCFAAPIAPPE